MASLYSEEAAKVQGQDTGHASRDIFDAIERGEYPQWDFYVQIIEDHDHPELDWHPLDDTRIWPEEQFPLRHLGTMTLNRNVEDHHNENEHIAMGTGVLVDGLDFSDDKMLIGRTFSYSDTQRYRVGPNYLQLPVNSPKGVEGVEGGAHTHQRGGLMSFGVDVAPGQNPHVNYEPSITGGLQEAEKKPNNPPEVTGQLSPAPLERTNDYLHARGRYCTMNEWERDHLVAELGGMIQEAAPQVQERFLWHLFMIHDDYGTRVGEYIGKGADDVRHLEPLPSQRFTDDETRRLENVGSNGDALDASEWGDWTSSVINHQVTAEEVLQGLGSLEYSR